jgi:hypothetical protein
VGASSNAATVVLTPGTHSLEYWGEDTLGQLEPEHHRTSVTVDGAPPSLTISGLGAARSRVLPQGARAYVQIAASDDLDGLQSDPSSARTPIVTSSPGHFVLTRTAVDRCGNRASASFPYSVTPAARIARLRVDPARILVQHDVAQAEVRYIDSQAAVASFAVQAVKPGKVRRGRCGAGAARLAHASRACARYVTVAVFRHDDHAGANRVRLGGRRRGLALPPGVYRLRGSATAPGGTPGPASYTYFRVRQR